MAEYVTSQKGKRKLCLGPFMFVKVSDGADNKEIWKCEIRTCNARVHTKNDIVTFEFGVHTHAPVHGKVAVTKARAEMKQRAKDTEEKTRQIVQHTLTQVSVQHANLLPQMSSLTRDVCRHRQRNGMNDNHVEKYNNTISGNTFIRIKEPDFILFAAQEDIDFLFSNQHWFADGTFRVTPEGFHQLYTIHLICYGQVFPCIYALLPGKSEAVYRRLLQCLFDLKSNGCNALPLSIITDFEMAAIKAMKDAFPHSSLSGRYFHFGQSVWRKLQAEGKAVLYSTDEDYSMKVKQMMALAFVPENDVIDVYEKLTNSDPFKDDPDNMDFLMDYFEDNYIGRTRRGRRSQPRFPISLWNQHERVVNDLPRTNNATEGWHNAFNSMVDIAHPTPGRLARKLQQ